MKMARFLAQLEIFFFVLGIVLMVVAEHIDTFFLVGLGFFLLGLIMYMIGVFWKAAGWMDKKTRKYFD
jgi:hypothetical protein